MRKLRDISSERTQTKQNPFLGLAREFGLSVTVVEKAGHGDKKARNQLTDQELGHLSTFVDNNRKAIEAYKRK